VKDVDNTFFAKSGDAINMFCLKSFYSLFTNVAIDPSNVNECDKSEMAYFMLDLIFLLGDPRQSKTLIDDPDATGEFIVGEAIPFNDSKLKKQMEEELKDERKVRIDRTS